MTFDEAKEILSICTRGENRDHAFGDREVYWTLDDEDVAEGYFSAGTADVFLLSPEEQTFTGLDATILVRCGASVNIGRNDETGPDRYWGA